MALLATGSPNFALDPVTDTALIAGAGGVSLALQLVISTGELKPQGPGDPNDLLFIDRPIALADPPAAFHNTASNLLVGGAFVFALADTAAAALVDRDDSWLTHGTLYAESVVLSLAVNNLVKIGVRRPRPRAYQEARAGMLEPGTDVALSFYSSHTSVTAALSATATYLAFARGEDTEGWIIGGAGLALTSLVGIERVLAAAHFPTDVIAGALAGASIGVLVPHLHRVGVSAFTAGPPGTIGLSIFGAI